MENRKLFAFTGASGTGKSTLLNLIEKDLGIKTLELSGRPYLPKEGDYVTNKSDSINRRISYGSLVTFTKALLKYPNQNLFFSRCAIDKLAYSRALNVGEDLHEIISKEIIEIVRPYITVFYLPIEFPLTDINDVVRGNNEKIRFETDQNIVKILQSHKIKYKVVRGTVEERMNFIKSHI